MEVGAIRKNMKCSDSSRLGDCQIKISAEITIKCFIIALKNA